MKKEITLKFTDYYVTGMADVTPWGGGTACIEMTAFHVTDLKDKTLLNNINDAGFGVESINGAICNIYVNYEGHHVPLKDKIVGTVSDHTMDTYDDI